MERELRKKSERGAIILVVESAKGALAVAKYEPGDFVKFEIKDEKSGEVEWMWLRVDRSDELNRVVFGWLDSQPVIFGSQLKLGQHLAVSYDNIRASRKANEF